jgi:hypothetical protein
VITGTLGDPASRRSPPWTQGAARAGHPAVAALARKIQRALGTYLKGRRLVRVQIRHIEGNNIEGFLKIGSGRSERLLVDFKAALTPEGGLSALEVDGRKIVLAVGASKRGG